MDNWLATVGAQARIPQWSEIASDLSYHAMKKVRLRTEWMKYRAKVLDAGDEGIRSIRRDIRTALNSITMDSLSLTELTDAMLTQIKPSAVKNISPCTDEKLVVMILYEVDQYG